MNQASFSGKKNVKGGGVVVSEMLWYAPYCIVVFHLLKNQEAYFFKLKKKGQDNIVARMSNTARKQKY